MPPDQDGQGAPLPHILVVIPTRNRPTDLRRCLESLASVAYPSWELLIVDQSDGDDSRQMAERYRDRLPPLTHYRMPECGLCRARNVGLRRAGTGIVAYIDDDCTVSTAWLTDVAAAFHRHPATTLIFGSVHATPHQWRELFVPVVTFEEERVVIGSFKHADWGMGASMYLWPARSPNRHRFDVHLGPGTRWPAADDRDYAYRVIRSGEPLVVTPAIRVCHHGARSLRDTEARELFRGYARADGAMDMKMIRCGDCASVLRTLAWVRYHLARAFSTLRTTGRPRGLGTAAMYVRGLAESFLLPVDRARCLYRPTQAAQRREG